MKVLRNLENSIRNIICLPWSIIFNFHYLPVKQAVKLPILFQVIPTFLSLKGKVKITNENIHRGMIILGAKISCQNERKKFRWQCHGTVVFGGEGILIGQQSFIHVGEKAILEIGQQSTFSLNLKIFCRNRIAFKDKNRVSWNCTFIDTDFHPLIDMVRHKSIPESNPIIIG